MSRFLCAPGLGEMRNQGTSPHFHGLMGIATAAVHDATGDRVRNVGYLARCAWPPAGVDADADAAT